MIADLIPKIAEFDQEARAEKKIYYPRPSLAGPDRCIRQMVYWGLGFEGKPLPGRTLVIFDDSSFHEELTLDWIRKSAFAVHSEQMEVDCAAPMRKGHIDALIQDMLSNDWLLEHKAINHFTFMRYWNGEVPMDYLAQTCIYDNALRKVAARLAGDVLLIKNKNTAAYLEFIVELQDDDYVCVRRTNSLGETRPMDLKLDSIVKDCCDKFFSVEDYMAQKRLPKRPYEVDDWHCSYCAYGETCWGDYQKDFYELKTEIMLPNEVADMIRFYRETGAQQKDLSAAHDDLRDRIKKVMKDNGVREGYAGEFICRLKLQKNNVERLYISTLKEKRHHGDESETGSEV